MEMMTKIIKNIDSWVWGLPLILLILLCGIWLTFRIRGLQIRRIGLALKFMVNNEEEGEGEVTSFGALCTALSATIGTGNIVGVATAIAAGGPGALFWMEIVALFGMILACISSHPFVSRRCEVPEEYVAEIRAQSVGVYSKKVPLLPIYISIEQFSAGRAYYTVHYFPFGTLGMSYSLTDGFCQENPLTGLQ